MRGAAHVQPLAADRGSVEHQHAVMQADFRAARIVDAGAANAGERHRAIGQIALIQAEPRVPRRHAAILDGRPVGDGEGGVGERAGDAAERSSSLARPLATSRSVSACEAESSGPEFQVMRLVGVLQRAHGGLGVDQNPVQVGHPGRAVGAVQQPVHVADYTASSPGLAAWVLKADAWLQPGR